MHRYALFPLFLIVGCGGGLNEQKTVEMNAGDIKTFVIDPAKTQKTLKVDVQATGGPVDVHVYLDEDERDAEKAIMFQSTSPKVLAGKYKVENVQLEAPIPAHKAFTVRIAAVKKASVKVKMTN